MGCLSSKPDDVPEEPQVYSWDRKDRPDPKDFTIAKQHGITCGRMPGTVNGQQFIIEDCKDCSIYIFDYSAQVTVDKCENCIIFLGPTKGSVFLRDCKNCHFVVACQQFRSRECRKIITFLYCATQPIIESSSSMRFGCFIYYYPELQKQFEDANLSVYNNSWSSIYDFTPFQDGSDNWSLIPEKLSLESCIPKPDSELFENIEISFDEIVSPVPLSRGTRKERFGESCLLVFFAPSKHACKEVLGNIGKNYYIFDLVQSKEIMMGAVDCIRIFKDSKYSALAELGTVISLELNGENIIQHVENVLIDLNINRDMIFLSQDKESAKVEIDAFYSFISMSMS